MKTRELLEKIDNIRNFCIIAHIDHGKSTLADRLLEMTGTVEKRKMKEQLLDTMDLERERGITIKLQPATMIYRTSISNSNSNQYPMPTGRQENSSDKKSADDGLKNLEIENSSKIQNSKFKIDSEYILNLIDTPGHVDFGYEVSRSLAAVEGAVLLVDCTQGVQAQTLANLYQAIEQGLEIIPVINKIDLPNAEVEKTKQEIVKILGCHSEDIIAASGKTGEGVEKILKAIVEKIPAPKEKQPGVNRALIFDSKYDSYKGVLAYVRIVDGEFHKGDEIQLMAGGVKSEIIQIGKFKPQLVECEKLSAGDIGYIATGLKSVKECRVGDTITKISNSKFQISNKFQNSQLMADQSSAEKFKIQNSVAPLPGYKEARPMVYASFYPTDGEDYNQMRDALEKLRLNDAALTFEGESSVALGKGFRIGFLGLLHLEIIKERLAREFGMEPIITTPGVVYEILKKDQSVEQIYSASDLPDPTFISEIREPMVRLEIVSPTKFLGNVMDLIRKTTRSDYLSTEYLDLDRVNLVFRSPLSEVIINLHDGIKSVSSGYASFSYTFDGYQPADLVRMDVFVAEDKIEAFSQIVPRRNVASEGKRIVKKLKEVIPRQNFLVKIQAAVGGKIIARENITPFRKDVTGYLYGGDVTRKRKLLEKQKRGKKKMIQRGRVEIPQKAFLEVLKK